MDYLKWLYCLLRVVYFRLRIKNKLRRRQFGLSLPRYSLIERAKQISMLHQEILALLHFFVGSSRGMVLEIGSYIGGSTVILASAAKQFGKGPIIAIEAGGQSNHPDIPSQDILADLKKNLENFGVSDFVRLLNGFSNQQEIYQTVKGIVGSKEIDLLFIDADGNVARDFEVYGPLLKNGAVLVLDDYSSPLAPEKAVLVKQWADQAVSEGRVKSLGVWGWGTWIGLYVKPLY